MVNFLNSTLQVELDSDTISFYVNGKNYSIKHPDPSMTLLEFLRSNGLTGTKLGSLKKF
jgi:xanthine dehydrogenase/oxidase